ncbi:ATP-grasp domain-containing protein [Methylobacterium sp. JK268]
MRATPAVEPNPVPIIGQSRLIRAAFAGRDPKSLAALRPQAPDGRADRAGLLLDLSTAHFLRRETQAALGCLSEALSVHRHFTVAGERGATRLRVLAIVTAGDLMANTPLEFLLDDDAFSLDYLYVLPGEALPEHLPDHDVAILCVGYARENEGLLHALGAAVAGWRTPLLNRPEAVLRTSRHGLAAALATAESVLVPRLARVAREALAAWAAGGGAAPEGQSYPVLVRPVDSHAGNDLCKVDAPRDITAYLDAVAETEFYVTEYHDYSGADGMFRKYRIALVDGRPFLCHMASRDHWMIHYLNADMHARPERRAAEAAAMASFEADFARRHAGAFAEIHRLVGLDYLVIDCAEARDGRLLVFEADTAMIVHDMDDPAVYPYKAAPMRKVFDAFQAALRARLS